MSLLPIKDPCIRLIPSEAFRKCIAEHFSREPNLPETIQTMCKNKRIGNMTKTKIAEDDHIQFTKKEIKFITEQASEKALHNQDFREFFTDVEKKNSQRGAANKHPSCSLTLSLIDLKWLHKAFIPLRLADPNVPYLHELIQDCELFLPQNEILERNVELEARCEKLRKEQEAREYERMTRNVDNVRTHMPQDTIAFQMKQINRQLIAVAQFIFSVAAGFAFGFIGIELIVGQLDFGFRLLLGIMIALVIALAEIYFLAKKLNEEYDIAVQSTILEASKGKAKVLESVPSPDSNVSMDSRKMHKD